MVKAAKENLQHSVAFRVTDKEWRALKRKAEQENTTIPQLAKALLFGQFGFEPPRPKRNVEGQRVGSKAS
jgi:hypothetical protein